MYIFLLGRHLLASKCKSKYIIKFNIERKIKRAGVSLKLNCKSEVRSIKLHICLYIHCLSSHGYGWTAQLKLSWSTHTSSISTSDCRLTEDTAFLSRYIIKKTTSPELSWQSQQLQQYRLKIIPVNSSSLSNNVLFVHI